MNIDNHMCNAKTCLKTSQAKIEARDYETAFAMLSEAKADIDKLMEYVYALKVAASANAPSAYSSGFIGGHGPTD